LATSSKWRVDPGGQRALGQLDRMARVVGARPGHHRSLVAELGGDELDHPDVLVVGQRGGLARRPADHEAVRAVGEQVAADGDGGLLVDAAVAGEGGDHGRE
jgi:hypothetical protein